MAGEAIAARDANLIVAEGVAKELNAALIVAGETIAAQDANLIVAEGVAEELNAASNKICQNTKYGAQRPLYQN
jgi:hypothetical protein